MFYIVAIVDRNLSQDELYELEADGVEVSSDMQKRVAHVFGSENEFDNYFENSDDVIVLGAELVARHIINEDGFIVSNNSVLE